MTGVLIVQKVWKSNLTKTVGISNLVLIFYPLEHKIGFLLP